MNVEYCKISKHFSEISKPVDKGSILLQTTTLAIKKLKKNDYGIRLKSSKWKKHIPTVISYVVIQTADRLMNNLSRVLTDPHGRNIILHPRTSSICCRTVRVFRTCIDTGNSYERTARPCNALIPRFLLHCNIFTLYPRFLQDTRRWRIWGSGGKQWKRFTYLLPVVVRIVAVRRTEVRFSQI